MKVVHSSFFRAICAIIVGALLIQYREQTVTWITIAIGVLFFLSGIISIATYYSAKRNAEKVQILFDAQGRQITGLRPNFPIVGLGSLILGAILALMPNTFINGLMFILAAILIMGAMSQFINLASARKIGNVGFIFWIFPSIILLVGLLAIIKPSAIAEMVNAFKISNNKRKWAKAEEISSVPHTDDTPTDDVISIERKE